MANKQFRIEKRFGTSVCADISQYALKNQYIQFLYEKITPQKNLDGNLVFFVVVGFWIKFGFRKLFFFTNIDFF